MNVRDRIMKSTQRGNAYVEIGTWWTEERVGGQLMPNPVTLHVEMEFQKSIYGKYRSLAAQVHDWPSLSGHVMIILYDSPALVPPYRVRKAARLIW